MPTTKRSALLRLIIMIAVVGSLMVPLLSTTAQDEPYVPDYSLWEPRYFPETEFWLQGPFREYWETHGGLYIMGYPITGVFMHADGLYKQYFERAIFEYHPEYRGTKYQVLLQRLGAIRTADRTNEEPFLPLPADTESDANCNVYQETLHRLCFGFKEYWLENGALPNFGFPISEEFEERNQDPPAGDGQIHTVQYFERNRFEYHPEFAGTQFETLLGLLGTEYLLEHGAPTAALAKQSPTTAPVDPVSQLARESHIGYGFNAFVRGGIEPIDIEFNQKTFALTKEAGFQWIHFQARWEDMETSPGVYDLFPMDSRVNQAHDAGIQLMISIVGPTPAWYANNGDIPSNPADFAKFAGMLAERYKGKVQAWQIWNEQNLAQNAGGDVQVPKYNEMLKAAYPAIKRADPNAIVVYGALTPNGLDIPSLAVDDVVFLQRSYARNNGEIRNYFDVLGAHPGSNDNTPDQWWPGNPGSDGWSDHNSFYFRRVEDLRKVMVANGDGDKQMWLTEFGWTTANQEAGYEYGANNSEQDQAAYLVRAFEIAKTEYPWMGVMFVWQLNYAVITPPSNEMHPWGVLRADWSKRPSYDALKNMPK